MGHLFKIGIMHFGTNEFIWLGYNPDTMQAYKVDHVDLLTRAGRTDKEFQIMVDYAITEIQNNANYGVIIEVA